MSSSISSSSSSSSTTSIIKKLNDNKIASCVLGISRIGFNTFNKNFIHAALFLNDHKCDESDNERGEGIIIEYGDYPSKDDKVMEEKKVKEGNVIYHYDQEKGEIKKGGLRYYSNTLTKFKEIFCNICYVDMEIENLNEITFMYFIDKIASKNEEKWTKEKYKVNPIFGSNHHCQVFAAEALKILKPDFRPKDIIVIADEYKGYKKKIDIFPDVIKNALKSL